jgi:hypothetical protein
MIGWFFRLWAIKKLWNLIRGSGRNSPRSGFRG